MRYYILSYKYTENASVWNIKKESKRIRHTGELSRVELVSHTKIKEWNPDFIVSEFECDRSYSVNIFESYIKKHFDLTSWKEIEDEEFFNKVDNLSIDLGKYLEYDLPKSHNIINRKSRIVYFLWRDNKIVYVGQSTAGLARPYEHKDKEWDQLSYVEVDKTYNLSIIEMFFICK